MRIGVLAMQGAFEEHIKALQALGVETAEVRLEKDLENIDGIIIPGGESTTIGKMLDSYNLTDRLISMGKEGFPMFGTCAGMIMLSREIEDGLPGQTSLGLLKVVSCRNAYGRQINSFETDLAIRDLGEKPFRAVFIRAPIISEVKNNVTILAKFQDKIVAVKEDNILALAFHPELTDDYRFHEYFIEMVKGWRKENGKNNLN
ncbi:MAG: pyridoxal 5'-phosphate synthase glutaminase subunit PdxT [Firmicutes bacterium]|nr:pyridoxal 5'-phosphate synthase glutaminase subunit PdxT [Bacillota bacterium]